MKINVVVLLRKKLGSLDFFLPVLLEIEDKYPHCKFIIVCPDMVSYDINRKSYDLWKGIESLNAKAMFINGNNKFATFFRLLKLLFILAFNQNVICKVSMYPIPGYRSFMRVLKKLSKVIEIQFNIKLQWPIEGIRNIVKMRHLMSKRSRTQYQGKGVNIDDKCDYFVSNLSVANWAELFGVNVPRDMLVLTGYIRRLPQWEAFLAKRIARNRLIHGKSYCVFFMSTLSKRTKVLNEPDYGDLFREAAIVLKKYNKKIDTIFKPHSITDIDKLSKILGEIGFTNYKIDYGHPLVLASKAKFVISYNFSTTMIESFFLGKPVVEYCSYDPELLELFGNGSIAGRCCDFFINRDVKKLEDTLNKLIYNKIELDRDPVFIKEAFPEVNLSFYKFLDKIFLARDIL